MLAMLTLLAATVTSPTAEADRHVAQAMTAATQQRPADAIREADVALTLYTKDRKPNVIVVCAGSIEETLTGAIAAKKDGIAVGPGECDAHYIKAYALIEQRRVPEARAELATAIGMMPENAQYKNELAETYKAERNWAEAYRLFTEAADTAQGLIKQPLALARARRGMGFTLIEQGKLDDAEAMFREVLKNNPGDKGAKGELDYIASLRKRS